MKRYVLCKPENPIYILTSVDLTGVGGPMGTDHTRNNYTRFFESSKLAKQFAEEEYEIRTDSTFKWKKVPGGYTSTDLGFVIYDIQPLKVTKLLDISKALTWDQLADIYHEETGAQARIKPMDDIFAWAKNQPDLFVVLKKGTIHKIL